MAPQTKSASIGQISLAAPTAAEAREFVDAAENRLLELWIKQQRAQWVQETFITDDTELMAAEADEAVKAATSELAAQAHRFEELELPEDVERKLKLIKLSVAIPAPRDSALGSELSQISASLQSDYGKAKWFPNGPSGECLSLNDMEHILAHSRDPRELSNVWEGWHGLARPMRERFSRMVDLANQGAREIGFADVGAMWRSNYDMPPEAFAAELDRLWQQVRPLYVSLHAYLRWRLAEKYGGAVVRKGCADPGAHLLGNIWAQKLGKMCIRWPRRRTPIRATI